MIATSNGSAQPGGKASGAPRRAGRKQQGFVMWFASLSARLATWIAILTILFRCPATLEECNDDSPFVCKYYFQAKNAITPHAKPYYDHYAAPYVDMAQPYYNTVKTNVFVPARDYAVVYGEPWVIKGRDYAVDQWEVNGQPRIAQLRAVTQAHYDKSVAPHVSKAATLAEPYYTVARAQTVQAVENVVYPAYEFTRPYAVQGYHVSHAFAVTTVLPAAQWSWATTNAFLNRAVWPQLRIVYVENVEPQLVRIGERLGRYKSHAKSKVLRESSTTNTLSSGDTDASTTQSSFVNKSPPQGTSQSVVSENESTEEPVPVEDSQAEFETTRNPVEPPEAEEYESDEQQKVREMVAADLDSWQEKFASQAEQGAAEIEDSVDEIARGMIAEQANTTGAALVTQLEETIRSEMDDLKAKINSLVAQHLDDADIEWQEETVQAVRAAGVAIKSKAQAIRSWREQYDEELQNSVLASSDVHFAILDETRSLALQQIGMKWAWTEGVTYKDWAKYHELKSTLSDWTEELKQLIVTHSTLLEAQDAAAQLEDKGMTIASAAARELGNLKEVVQWKIQAEDATEEFDADKLKEVIEKRAKAAEEARLKAEEEARVKAEEEARAKAEEEARAAEEAAEAAEEAAPRVQDEDEYDDERIHSVKESMESKPLVSEDVATSTDATDGESFYPKTVSSEDEIFDDEKFENDAEKERKTIEPTQATTDEPSMATEKADNSHDTPNDDEEERSAKQKATFVARSEATLPVEAAGRAEL